MFTEFTDKLYNLHNGIKLDEPNILINNLFVYMILAFIAYFPISYIIYILTPHELYNYIFKLSNVFGMYIWYSYISFTLTLAYGIIFFKIWYTDLKKGNRCGLVMFIVGTLFAIAFATSTDVAFLPDNIVNSKYNIFINYALTFIKQASLFAVLPILKTVSKYAYIIFKNNLIYSIRSVIAGLIGGMIGFIIFGMIAVFRTAIIWGCTTGLIIRNCIEHGYNPFITPIASYLSGLGLPPFWHTFWEFFAFSVFCVFGSFITYGLITRKETYIESSMACATIGALILVVAAFNEVTFDASFIKLLFPHMNFTPHVAILSFNINYILTFITTIVSEVVLMVVIAWFVNYLMIYINDFLEGY